MTPSPDPSTAAPAPSLLKAWVLASRPKTLPAAVAPVLVGAGIAWLLQRHFSWLLLWCTLFSALAIQVATNFFNDALDFYKGADTQKRLGPTRVTTAGLVTPRSMLLAGAAVLLLACLLALPLLQSRGWAILAIGLPSLYFSFGYTGGPVPLAYRGLGEIFVLLFFGFIAVAGTTFVLTGQWETAAIVAGLQIGLLSTVLIAINNLRDAAEDATTGKRTLAVRFGSSFARWEIAACCLLPHLVGLLCWFMGIGVASWPLLFTLPLPTLLLGLAIMRGIHKNPPGAVYNKYLALGGLQLILFTALFLLAVKVSTN